MTIYNIKAKTNRVTNRDINNLHKTAPVSPNCGLSSYLAEAFIKSGITKDTTDDATKEVIDALISESQKYDDFENRLFWGWEKNATIPDAKYPFDWDDTSKALDVLYAAKEHNKAGNIDFNELPTDADLDKLFKESLFKRKWIGAVDDKIECPYHTSLFVFFGDIPNDMEKRDDPMVTVATLRMLAKWHPKVVKNNKRKVKSLIKRAVYTLNYLLINDSEKFEDFSKYYFSLGHFTYRLFETIDYLDKIGINIRFNPVKLLLKSKIIRQTLNFNQIKNKVYEAYTQINNDNNSNDCFWWYLLGLKIELITVQHDFKEKIENRCIDEIVYQHRRLNHQYYSKDWEKKLLIFELEKHNNTIHQDNIDNFQGLRFLKKTAIPIFAIVAFIVYVISLKINNNTIIDNIINETNVFKTLTDNQLTNGNIEESTINYYPYLKGFLNIIFLFLGVRLYLQAWAIEETFLTNRIKAPIKDAFWKRLLGILDNTIRFIWTLLIMVFPIYFSITNKPFDLSWYWYISLIYVFIFIWDSVIIVPYTDLYKNQKEKMKPIIIFWFVFDLILLILVILAAVTLRPHSMDLLGWTTPVFIIEWLIILALSLFQIFVFGRIIFSNKITYKYDT
jgi:hypothetical protein